MKRSPELTPLSHDHHQTLFAALKLKRWDDQAAASQDFLDFWRVQCAEHFRIEEDILLPGWLAGDDRADVQLATRVLKEHLEVRTLVRKLEGEATAADDLKQLGELLERHVRFEERELFPAIESGLDADALKALGAELARADTAAAEGRN
jgi:hemerythrin-like domain-containing protein